MAKKRYLTAKELQEAGGKPAQKPSSEAVAVPEKAQSASPSTEGQNLKSQKPAPEVPAPVVSAPSAPSVSEVVASSIQGRRYLTAEEIRAIAGGVSPKAETAGETPAAPAEEPKDAPAVSVKSGIGAAELSPMSAALLSHLASRLPERLNTLPAEECEKAIQHLRDGGAYTIGVQHAKGAESLLYQAESEGYNFLVKAIRNWKDHWVGDVNTRKDEGKLSDNVKYLTKQKHLSNEWAVGKIFEAKETSPIPVHFYSLRKVTKLGVELGWDLLMERINGIDLSDKKLISAMTLSDKVRTCIRMAQAIQLMHQRKMVHLDIKPSNFMLDRNGNLRLIDFGISVSAGYQSRTVAGTAGYFSPEQIACQPLNEDTDVFALGVAFAVLFGGKVLVQTPSEAKSRQFRHSAMDDLEKNDRSAVTDIPELKGDYMPLADVIRACTVFRRASRLGNCALLVSRLKQAAAACGVEI